MESIATMSTERFILQINLFVQPIPGIKDEGPEICRVTGCNSVMGSSLQNPESGCFNPRVVCVGQTAFQVNRKMVQKVKVPMEHSTIMLGIPMVHHKCCYKLYTVYHYVGASTCVPVRQWWLWCTSQSALLVKSCLREARLQPQPTSGFISNNS